jgi:hypothetical protein
MEEAINAYVDFSGIEDDIRKTYLDKPVLTVEGNVVSWTEVDKAEGYVVNVDGTEYTLTKDELSYTVGDGEHTVFVIAKGNGTDVIDSPASNSVIVGETQESSPVESESKKPGKGGFSSSVTSNLALLGMVSVVAVIMKKRKNV